MERKKTPASFKCQCMQKKVLSMRTIFFFIPTEEGTAISMWSSGPCEVHAVRKAKAVLSSSIILRPSGVEAATSRSAFQLVR